MPNLVTVPTLNVDDAISDAFVDALTADVNYLTVAGADLASAATIAPTHEFHKVTGSVTIDNIDHAAEIAGQQVRLWFTGNPLVRNNGGGTGNIRTATGADRVAATNGIATFVYDGTVWREQANKSPGEILDHTQFTAGVNITATTEGTAQTVVTASAVTFDGGPALIEFFCPWAEIAAVNGNDDDYFLSLFEDGSSIGTLGRWKRFVGASNQVSGPVLLRRRLTPTAAAHTYSVRAYRDESTFTLQAGAGGAGVLVPGYIRIEKDS